MRLIIIVLLSAFCFQNMNSQIYEVGVFAGGSNVIGDVGRTNYISPNEVAYGGIFKWNRSDRHSWRASIIYADISGDDRKSDDDRRRSRGYRYNGGLLELSVGMEFNFVEFNLHYFGRQSTPYIYTGVTVASHDNFFWNALGQFTDEGTKSWAYGIPIVLGIKSRLTPRSVIGFEAGARYTFSDELDGSVPDSEFRQDLAFGNVNNNDWYMFIGFTVTYTFARKPCYCDF
ncbi:hypothetical protein SAMN03097699_2241 [Flavobacteriaceae bacterium MAR_2010_188]|nr:hypothetical protein SAMN03097699_2241 [Flavobacteriaceae bacterium MAR_2010_188]